MSIVGYSYKNNFYSETTLSNRKHKALGFFCGGGVVCLFFLGGGVCFADYGQNENKFDLGVFNSTYLWEKGSNRGIRCVREQKIAPKTLKALWNPILLMYVKVQVKK